MRDIRFEWDSRKSRSNKAKHGVSFEEARTAFLDEHARVIPDLEHSEDEERFVLLGISIELRVLVVCHCYRESDHVVRIISARRADPSERRQYAKYLP
jgi:uncharacterized DUF497 family protein